MARLSTSWLLHLLACTVALPLAACTPPAQVRYSYDNVAFVGGGFITGFVAHPVRRDLRYLRTDIGGAYRWDANENRWLPLLDWLPFSERNLLGVESIALDPQDPEILYLAAGTYTNWRTPNGAILRSIDQGHHFEVIHLPVKMGANEDGRFAGERLQVDPNNPSSLLLATRLDGLWHSDDAAITWNRTRTFQATPFNNVGLTFVAYDKASGHPGVPTPVIFVGVCDPVINLLRSQDGGKSWKPVTGGPVGMFPNHATFSSDGVLYLSYSNMPGPNGITSGAVWVFDPPTNQWRNITPERPVASGRGAPARAGSPPAKSSADALTAVFGLPPGIVSAASQAGTPPSTRSSQGFGYGMLTVDQQHPKTVLVSTIDRWNPGDTIFRTSDAGFHWQSLREGAVRDASLAPYLKHGAAQAPFGHWIGAAMIDPFDSSHVLYGTGETIWESHDVTDGAATHWAVGAPGVEETADITLLSPAAEGSPHLYTGLGDIGCFRNDDFAHSPAGGALQNPELSNCDAIAMAASAPREMVRVGRSWTPKAAHGAVSHDGGLHWIPFSGEPEGGERGGDAAISADGKWLLWAVTNGPLAMSSDGGAHWRTVPLRPATSLTLQVVADVRVSESFLVYDPAAVQSAADKSGVRTVEAGSLYGVDSSGTVRDLSKSVPREGRLRVSTQDPATLWIGSNAGLWRSVDTGVRWQALPNVAAAYAVGFGKAASGRKTPAIYMAGALTGTTEAAPPRGDQTRGGGIYRSLDDGDHWQRIDDADHRFAWIEQITGDPRVFGRVYLGTNGRGVLWGDPAE